MVSSGEQEYLTTANCNRPGLPSNSNHARDPAKMFFSYLKKEARQLKDPKKEMMVSLKGKVIVINKSEWPKYKKKGYIQAEEVGENFDVGTPENTKSKLESTPGQSTEEWEEQVETIQKKNTSMRERLAKVWEVEEGTNPFASQKKKEEKTSKKTMTGEPVTKIEVDPKIDDK